MDTTTAAAPVGSGRTEPYAAGQCTHYPGRGLHRPRCPAPATVRMLDQYGSRVPGVRLCAEHAAEIIREYIDLLDEEWEAVPLSENE